MRSNRIVSILGAALLIGSSAISTTAIAASHGGNMLPTDKQCSKMKDQSTEIAGWCAAVDRRKGNCLACHVMITPKWPAGFPEGGNTAPPFTSMKARFPDKAKLRAQISEPRDANPKTLMPPFGTHKLLSDQQIDDIVEFLYTL